MGFGSTSGRGLESRLAPYVYGAILLVAVLLWFRFRHDIRAQEKKEQAENEERDD